MGRISKGVKPVKDLRAPRPVHHPILPLPASPSFPYHGMEGEEKERKDGMDKQQKTKMKYFQVGCGKIFDKIMTDIFFT